MPGPARGRNVVASRHPSWKKTASPQRGWDAGSVDVAYWGVDDEFLSAIPERAPRDGPLRLLFAGSFSRRKDRIRDEKNLLRHVHRVKAPFLGGQGKFVPCVVSGSGTGVTVAPTHAEALQRLGAEVLSGRSRQSA